MKNLSPVQQQVFATLRQIIAEETNHDPEEIHLDSHLEDDLSVVVEPDNGSLFSILIKKINRSFDIDLDPAPFVDESYENQTVDLLVELVADEIDLQ